MLTDDAAGVGSGAALVGEGATGAARPSRADPEYRGFLTTALARSFTFWFVYCSWTSAPPFWPSGATDTDLRRREVYCEVLIGAAVLFSAVFFVWGAERCGGVLCVALATAALWRIMDLCVVCLSNGLFGGLAVRGWIQRAQRESLERVLVLALLNYLELILWFASVYWWISLLDRSQFNAEIMERSAAYFLSLSTVSTIGYGTYAPVGGAALLAATIQAVVALVLVVAVLGTIIGGLGSRPPGATRAREGAAGGDGAAGWVLCPEERAHRWKRIAIFPACLFLAVWIGFAAWGVEARLHSGLLSAQERSAE